MNDWLSQPEDANYLALDEPPMPDDAPMPPTPDNSQGNPAPFEGQEPQQAGSGDWLAADTAAAPVQSSPMPAPVQQQSAPPQHSQAPASSYPAPAPMGAPAVPAPPQQNMHEAQELHVSTPQLPDMNPAIHHNAEQPTELSSLVLDVEVDVEVGLGNAALTVEEFLEMGRGSVVELDTQIDTPIELKVKGRVIARGQLVSINGRYGMRITEMLNEEN